MHKLLARQLRRKAALAGDAEWSQALADVAAMAGAGAMPAGAARLLSALPSLFGEVENTYQQFDRDLELRRRSLEISSRELMQLNNQLHEEAASRQRALDTLRGAANRLLSGAQLPPLREGEANLESLSSMMAQLAREREAALQKLGVSEERLVLALSVTESVAWDWDIAADRLVVISEGDEVLGYPRERIEHDPPRIGELVDPPQRRLLRARLIEHLRGDTPEFKFGVWMTIKECHRRYMLFHGKVVARNSAGRATRMAGIMHDLTASKKTEEALRVSEARFRTLTELAADWYWELDDQHRFTSTHGYGDTRGGIAALAHIGRARWELPHTQPVGFTWDEHRAALARHDTFRDLVLRREVPGEAVRYISFSGAPVFSARGRFAGYYGISKDVTGRVQAEERLRESQVAAESATRAKSQFLANMSHEIRTPMNGVLGMTELLLGTPLNARQRQFAETARRSGESLLALINDILDFSKIEAGKMEIDRVEFRLRDMLDDVAQLLAESAASKGLEVVCRMLPGVPDAIIGDPNRMRQILINLIGNAIKFTEHGEVVTEVRVVTGAAGTRALCFEVRDTGIGILREAQANIFEAFSQADGSTTRHYGGTGLGLAICRQLVSLMGGEISLESEPGRGSVFRFSLPCVEAPRTGVADGPLTHAAWLRGKRLLVVDDNAASRAAVRDVAEGVFGMRCTLAGDGVSALKVAREALAAGLPFDVALVDAVMPNLDGMALGELFRLDDALAGMRLILATTLNGAAEADRARAVGFAATITKPLRQGELLRVMMLAFGTDPGVVSQKLRAGAPAPALPAGQLHGRVLVAEDYPVNQQVIRAVLEALGCDVTMAHNGREAVEALQRSPFDLVFMDCQMPEMDGYMATRAIRALEQESPHTTRTQNESHPQGAPRRTPIVALTAHATQADRERCLEAGMDSYVSKPFTQAVLLRELKRWLPGSQAEGETAAAPPLAVETQRLDLRAINELRSLDSAAPRNLLQGFVETYLTHTAELLDRVRASIEAGDMARVEQEAHKLKSGSLTIGAVRVGKLAQMLEQESVAGDAPRCRALLAELDGEFATSGSLLRAQVSVRARGRLTQAATDNGLRAARRPARNASAL